MLSRGAHRRARGRVHSTVIVVAVAVTLVATSSDAVAAVARAPKPAQAPVARSAREVPLLKSQPTVRPATPARPAADYQSLSTRTGYAGSRFDPKRSRLVSRSMFEEIWQNVDGTRTARQSTAPLNVPDGAGGWRATDTALGRDAASSRMRPAAHVLNPSLAARADDPALVSVEIAGLSVALALDRAAPAPAAVKDASAIYRDVLPGVDLEYEVTPGAVKETLVLKKPGSSSWRFRLNTRGLTPVVDKAGAVLLSDAAGVVRVVLPPIETWDSSGGADQPPATTGGTYGLERDGNQWLLTVSVDPKWLDDPRRTYPVRVDPTFSFGVVDSWAYRTDGYACQNCGLRIGNSLYNGDSYNRSVFGELLAAVRAERRRRAAGRVAGARLHRLGQVVERQPAPRLRVRLQRGRLVPRLQLRRRDGAVRQRRPDQLHPGPRPGQRPDGVLHADRQREPGRVDLQAPRRHAVRRHRLRATGRAAGRSGGRQRAGHPDADAPGRRGDRPGRRPGQVLLPRGHRRRRAQRRGGRVRLPHHSTVDGAGRRAPGRRRLHLAGDHGLGTDQHGLAVDRAPQGGHAHRRRGTVPCGHRRHGHHEPGQRQRVDLRVLADVQHGRWQRGPVVLVQLAGRGQQGAAGVVLQRPEPQLGHRRRRAADPGPYRAPGQCRLGEHLPARAGPAGRLLHRAVERVLPGPGRGHLPVRGRARRQDHGLDQQRPGVPR